MVKKRVFFAIAVALTINAQQADCRADNVEARHVIGGTDKLKGKVEQSDWLPTISGGVRIGDRLDATKIKLPRTDDWYPISSSLAGTWQPVSHSQHTFSYIGQRVVDDQLPGPPQGDFPVPQGLQLDSTGQIWDYGGFWLCHSSGETIDPRNLEKFPCDNYDIEHPLTVVENDDHKLVRRWTETRYAVDRRFNKVTDIVKSEVESRIELINPTTRKEVIAIKTFDASGNPRSTVTISEEQKRQAPFAPQAKFASIDCRESITRYFIKNRMLDRFPLRSLIL